MAFKAVEMITSFGSDGGDGGHTNTNEIPEEILSIHLANYGKECSKHNYNSSVASFESTAYDGRTINYDDDVPVADAPTATSDLENDNIDDTVVTSDNDDDDNSDNDDNDTADM